MQRKFLGALILSLFAWSNAIAADKRRSRSSARCSATTWCSSAESRTRSGDGRKPGDVVQVEIAGHTAKAVADADGRWQVRIKPPAHGRSLHRSKLTARRHVELHEVLVGDVWLCGGQSNMELGLARTRNGQHEISNGQLSGNSSLQGGNSHTAYSPRGSSPGTMENLFAADRGRRRRIFRRGLFFCAQECRSDIHVPDRVGGRLPGRHAGGSLDQPGNIAPVQRF